MLIAPPRRPSPSPDIPWFSCEDNISHGLPPSPRCTLLARRPASALLKGRRFGESGLLFRHWARYYTYCATAPSVLMIYSAPLFYLHAHRFVHRRTPPAQNTPLLMYFCATPPLCGMPSKMSGQGTLVKSDRFWNQVNARDAIDLTLRADGAPTHT